MEEAHKESTPKKEKTIGVKFILGWVFGLLFLLAGVTELFKTPALGFFTILAALVIFPPFMRYVSSKTGFRLSTVLRIILFFVLLGIGAGINASSNKTAAPQTNEASTNNNNQTATQVTSTSSLAPLVVDATTLVGEYDKNKLAAQDKYTGKVVQTTGYIENISNDITGTYYLSLNPSEDQYYVGTSIACYFNDKSALTSLAKGQSVTVKGTMQDMSLGIVNMKDCSLVK